MNSYLTSFSPELENEYNPQSTYLSPKPKLEVLSDVYYSLPEEYNIFSNIDFSFFINRNDKQQEQISNCLIYLRQIYFDFLHSNNIIGIFPKFYVTENDNGTITFNIATSNYSAFISFDNESGNYDSYSGIVIISGDESMSTSTFKLDKENYKGMLDRLMSLIISSSI